MSTDWIELATESSNAAAFERAVLGSFQDQVGFDAAFFSTKGAEDTPTVVGLDAATVALSVQRGPIYFQELLPVKAAALAARGVAVDTRVLGVQQVRKMAYHRELASSIGGRHSLLAYVPWRGRIVAALMLGRVGSAFTDRDIARVEACLPALGVTRAAFGLPHRSEPLPVAGRPGLLERLGLSSSRSLASRATPSGMLSVRDRNGFREMVATHGGSELIWTRSALHDPSRSGWPYVELFHVAAAMAKHRRRALFIGCGGGVALQQFATTYPGIAIDVVEREPAVIELARAWYGLDTLPDLAIHVGDGAEFLERAEAASWDVIVIDAYDAERLAESLLRRDFFSDVWRTSCPGGALAINVIASLDGHEALRRVLDAVRERFDTIRLLPVMNPDERYAPSDLRNVVVVARRDD